MTGLTRAEVETRIQNGQVNANENPNTRTIKQIILQNSLTFFNFLNLCLVSMVIAVGSFKNCLFFGVIIFNTLIGIVQEVRAKKVIDQLAILTQSKAVVLREGKKWSIATDQLVLDDIIYLKTGDQIPADARIVEGILEVNESLLTGEADNLQKKTGDELYSGSFVTSGEGCCQIIHVGKDNYASKITSEAKEYKRHNSELRNSMNAILKVVSIMVIPVGAMMFYKQYYIVGNDISESVVSMVASVLGMIPDGLVLLTSIALTLGAVYLAQKKTLIQEMYCIETLAHVDTLCLDKTGTITEGTMCVEEVVTYAYQNPASVETESEKSVITVIGTNASAIVCADSHTTKEKVQNYAEKTGSTTASATVYADSDTAKEKVQNYAEETGSTTASAIVCADSDTAKEKVQNYAEETSSTAASAYVNSDTAEKTSQKYAIAACRAGNDAAACLNSETGNQKTEYPALPLSEIESIMANLMAVQHDANATANALKKRFPAQSTMELDHAIPFSSDRKYSGAVFENGTYLMGAMQFLFPEGNVELQALGQEYAKQGLRVLVLAYSENKSLVYERPENLYPIAILLLTDVIRAEAPDTLAFFDSQGVDLKVISGDDPVTVSAIAKKAGLKNADLFVDATTLTDEEALEEAVKNYSVFGRVTPQQKKAMVLALKKQGHTVAMTGDGVNDVLAFKEADCSIAMAEGSDAAKNVANVVLMDSNFASMPHIVNQGRRVVNNIRTAASMFLIKTIFSALLALLTIFFGDIYPFEPIQMSLISTCAVGIPTFFLAQEFNYNKIDHTFLRHVFMNAFPAAVTITGCVFSMMLICQNIYHSTEMLGTACVLVTGWNYMSALKTVYSPLNTYRKIIIYGMQFIFFVSAAVLQDLLVLGAMEFRMIVLVFLMMTFSPILIDFITARIRRQYENLDTENPGRFLAFIRKLQKK